MSKWSGNRLTWAFRASVLVWAIGGAFAFPGAMLGVWWAIVVGMPIMFVGGALIHLTTTELIRRS